ncbi:MAG: flagellar protein FlaG [Lachnospiraceae bacterium]|nr:flagellar protein FlaG [Lachnospiraceae bacterium]
MAIEPISSLMTVQAQGSAVTQKPQTPVETERPDSSTSSAPAAELVDRTTAVVENAQEKGNANSNDQGKEQQQLSHEQIRKAVERLNKNLANSEAVFGIHEDTNRVTIKIVDKNTKEVIKELPPEKTLDMIAKVWEMAGILIDERR